MKQALRVDFAVPAHVTVDQDLKERMDMMATNLSAMIDDAEIRAYVRMKFQEEMPGMDVEGVSKEWETTNSRVKVLILCMSVLQMLTLIRGGCVVVMKIDEEKPRIVRASHL